MPTSSRYGQRISRADEGIRPYIPLTSDVLDFPVSVEYNATKFIFYGRKGVTVLYPKEEFTGKNGIHYLLRSPETADAQQMIAYLKATAEETEYGLSYPEELNFTVKDEEDFISRYSEDEGSIMISVFDGDRLVGNASLCCVMQKKKTLHRATFGIAIRKSDWGQGLGRKILSELITFAKQAGYELLELEVVASNKAAVRLYKNMGFIIYGERPLSLKRKNGDYYDELLMVLDLTK